MLARIFHILAGPRKPLDMSPSLSGQQVLFARRNSARSPSGGREPATCRRRPSGSSGVELRSQVPIIRPLRDQSIGRRPPLEERINQQVGGDGEPFA